MSTTAVRHPDPHSKIVSIRDLAEQVSALREGRRVVLCHGVFDLLHVGHLRHLRSAKSHGDLLVVTVTPDHLVNKGPGRPVFEQELRAESLAALEYVDLVAINDTADALRPIALVRPDVYAKGPDYANESKDVTGMIIAEREAVVAVNGRLVTTDDATFSSSAIINRFLPVFSEEQRAYLAYFRSEHDPQELEDLLAGFTDKSVLVVGETIVDVYDYCTVLGKSSKEPVLAAKLESQERFAGGAVAVANHVAGFARRVTLATRMGEERDLRRFVEGHLLPNVTAEIQTTKAPTIVKQRFVDAYLQQKLFETYTIDELRVEPAEHDAFTASLGRLCGDHDLVVVVDYGHGLLTRGAVEAVCGNARFLAVNAQTNAGNHGLNTISKYPRADYICIALNELALDTRRPDLGVRDMVRDLVDRVDCGLVTVTQGKGGILCYDTVRGFAQVPSLAPKVVDRIGAGDAVLSVTSLCAQAGATPEIIGFVGNAVGAEAVQIVGNKSTVERRSLTKHIHTLMK